jgi:hypothetical protein
MTLNKILVLFGVMSFILGLILKNSYLDINLKDTYYMISYFYIGLIILLIIMIVIFIKKKRNEINK